jgi:hypothetical protein
MPNIIEQQDLLKGLPDDRLSMLMQNPTGDIPPFLVAAEAQRRQSIREQFSGGPQESVVDTLTKQLASVPQNIEAPMQTPPQMPPPQMQAGVGALQPGMRDGGMVQRYQDGSLVGQSWPYNTAAYDAYRGITSFLSSEPTVQKVVDRVGSSAVTEPGYEDTSAAYQIYKSIFPDTEKKERRFFPEINRATQDAGGMAFTPPLPVPTDPSKKPRDETAAQQDSSYENQSAAEKAALRKRLEELYGRTEVSDWEKAQKWFAMAGQFVQPSKNIMQNIAAGASAFAEGAAAEQAAARESAIARERALLELDMSEYEADRKARAELARDELDYQRDIAKMKMLAPGDAIRGYSAQIEGLQKRLDDTMLSDEERKSINTEINSLRIAIASIMKGAGYGAGGVEDINAMRQLAAGQ